MAASPTRNSTSQSSPSASLSSQASPTSPTAVPTQQLVSSSPPPITAEDASPSSSSLSPSISPFASSPRQNKYHGPPSTWRNWTAPERDLAASLDQIRASNLSIHLYNAFALKRRAGKRHFGRPPIDADKVGNEGDKDAAWAPPKVWTAWPMHVDEVPREEDKSKWEDTDTPKRPALRRPPRPGDALRELLVARVLKKAKEQFEAREWDDGEPDDKEERAKAPPRRSQSRRKSNGRSSQARTNDDHTASKGKFAIKKRPLRPVMMADDDLATALLRPSIQHILSKLDDVLLGLHRARAAYGSTKPRKRSQHPDPDSTDPTPTRHRGRKRTRSSMRSPHTQPSDSGSESNYSTSNPPSRHRHRRRRRTSSPSSSNDAMSISPLSPHAKPTSPSPSASPDPRPTQPHPDQKPHHTRQKSQYKASFAPRDWSDVLGLAALTGWDPSIVHRTAGRCADLFGEGMAFRVFHSGDKAEERGVLQMVRSKEGGGGGEQVSGEAEEEGHADMYGGVHVDGFMQPVKGKRWWGRDRTGRIASASRVFGRKIKGDGDAAVRDDDGDENDNAEEEEDDEDEDSDDDDDDDDDENENRTTETNDVQSDDGTDDDSSIPHSPDDSNDDAVTHNSKPRPSDNDDSTEGTSSGDDDEEGDQDDQEDAISGDIDDNSENRSREIQEAHSDSESEDAEHDAFSNDSEGADEMEMEIERGRRQQSVEL